MHLCVFSFESEAERLAADMLTVQERTSMQNLIKMLSAVEAKSHALEGNTDPVGSLAQGHAPELWELEGSANVKPSEKFFSGPFPLNGIATTQKSTTATPLHTLKPLTKDVFMLPLTQPTTKYTGSSGTTTTSPVSSSVTTTVSTKHTTMRELVTLCADNSTTKNSKIQSQLNPLDTSLTKENSGNSQFRFVLLHFCQRECLLLHHLLSFKLLFSVLILAYLFQQRIKSVCHLQIDRHLTLILQQQPQIKLCLPQQLLLLQLLQ